MPSSPKRQKGTHEDDGGAIMNRSALVATEEAIHSDGSCDKVKHTLHSCNKCDRVFKNQGMLSLHMKHKHNGVPPPTCSTCSKVFKTKTELGNHVMNKHTDRDSMVYIEYKAGVDGRLLDTFAKNGSAVCTTCNKEFKTKSILKTHIMIFHSDRNSVEYKKFIGKRSGKRRGKYANEDDANEDEYKHSDNDEEEEEELVSAV